MTPLRTHPSSGAVSGPMWPYLFIWRTNLLRIVNLLNKCRLRARSRLGNRSFLSLWSKHKWPSATTDTILSVSKFRVFTGTTRTSVGGWYPSMHHRVGYWEGFCRLRCSNSEFIVCGEVCRSIIELVWFIVFQTGCAGTVCSSHLLVEWHWAEHFSHEHIIFR